MTRLLALWLVCGPLFAASIVMVPAQTSYVPSQCSGNICVWPLAQGVVNVVGVGGSGAYINIFEQVDATTIAYRGPTCGIPSHCGISSDGAWQFAFGLSAGQHTLYAVLFDALGPPIPGCVPDVITCTTPGNILAFSNVVTVTNLPQGQPIPVPPTDTGCSAPSITYGGTLTNGSDTWSILNAPRGEVMLDGQSAAGVWGSKVTCDATGITFTNQDNGAIQCWTGSSWRNC